MAPNGTSSHRNGGGVCLSVATPAYGNQFSGEYVKSLHQLTYAMMRQGVMITHSSIDYADIVLSRNYLISSFYFAKRDCTHLLFVDNDMGFEPSLIADMLALGEDVVGALIPSRSLNLETLHKAGSVPFKTAMAMASQFIGTPHPSGETKNGFLRGQRCGTGILLISRAAVQRLIKTDPSIVAPVGNQALPFPGKFDTFLTPFDKVNTGTQELSEDYSFCWRWTQKAQGRIWLAPHHRITHTGRWVYRGRYTDQQHHLHEADPEK